MQAHLEVRRAHQIPGFWSYRQCEPTVVHAEDQSHPLEELEDSQPLSPLSSPVQLTLEPGYSFLKRPGEVRPQSLPNTWEATLLSHPCYLFQNQTSPLLFLPPSPAPLHSSLLEGFIVLFPLSQKS